MVSTKEQLQARIERNREFVRGYKTTTPCTDCGLNYPYYVMDFDHLPGATKKFALGDIASRSYSLETILKEMEKCELVCANCHRIRTFVRRETTIS